MAVDPQDPAVQDRVNTVIQQYVDHPWPPMTGCTDHIGNLSYATAALWLNQNVGDANTKLAAVQMSHLTGKNCNANIDESRQNLWLAYLLRPYFLYNTQSSYFPGRMTSAAENNLVAQMWAYARPYSKISQAPNTWNLYDSENHDAQQESFNLLAAQAFKNRPDYANRTYADGSTVTQQYNAWADHWSNFFDERAKKGLFTEVGAPGYFGYTSQAIFNIYNFAEDPILRKKAEMVLDLLFADYAQQQLQNVWGGAKSRSSPNQNYDAKDHAMTYYANLLYGPLPAYGNHIMSLATSGYNPPPVVNTLFADRVGKGSFEYKTRRPGVGPLGWGANKNHNVDPIKSIVNYSFVTPDYVMGTAMLNPANSHVGHSAQNRWQGIIFNTTSADRVYPQAAPSSVDKVVDAFFSVQYKNVLITRKNGITQYPTLVYFPISLDVLDEQGGWIFVKEGSAYLAVRPAIGTYSWLTGAKNTDPNINNRFIRLSNVSSPIIFEAARASDYTSFDAFKADITGNPRSNYTNGILNYTGSNGIPLTFYNDSRTPKINGVPINYSPTNTFNSRYMQSAWNSGLITVKFGGRTATYDFRDKLNPTKTLT